MESFERYGCEAEALASQQARGLVPRPGYERQAKWIGEIGSINPKTLGKRKNYTYKIEIEVLPSTREWLKSFETKPTNEPGRYEISTDHLDEFNNTIRHLKVTKL